MTIKKEKEEGNCAYGINFACETLMKHLEFIPLKDGIEKLKKISFK